MVLEVGTELPVISAENQNGETVEVDFESPTVVYFYPADGTPGCATEAEQFQKEREVYEDTNVSVRGVSTDTVDSHREFSESLDLDFDLLADPTGEIGEAFGVPSENGRYERVTVVVVDGEVYSVYRNVDPDGHARDLLMDLLDDGIVSLD